MTNRDHPTRDHFSSRRRFLATAAAGALTPVLSSPAKARSDTRAEKTAPLFRTRGLVLSVSDLNSLDWPSRAADAGLTTIGTHISPKQVQQFIESEKGQMFLDACQRQGLHVEHELHAMSDLLPRSLFGKDPSMFRMNENGERVADWNLCVHSVNAIQVVCENAVKYAEVLNPTTGRYFFWIDDNQPMCHCSACRGYSESDQALILENQMLAALRQSDRRATLAHLAYMKTLRAPGKIQPAPGIFLEFAPIVRSWSTPLRNRGGEGELGDVRMSHGEVLDALDANLEVFGANDAQVLEYWMDVSMFSRWKRPAIKLPWRGDVFADDLQTYASHGIRHVTSFAVMIDGAYVKQYGEPPVAEYGQRLRTYSL